MAARRPRRIAALLSLLYFAGAAEGNPYSGILRLSDGSPPGPGMDSRPYAVFRASRIPRDHPGLRDKVLVPLEPQPAPADPEK